MDAVPTGNEHTAEAEGELWAALLAGDAEAEVHEIRGRQDGRDEDLDEDGQLWGEGRCSRHRLGGQYHWVCAWHLQSVRGRGKHKSPLHVGAQLPPPPRGGRQKGLA